MGCYIPMNKIFYGGHLGSHLVFLKTTRHQLYFYPQRALEQNIKKTYFIHLKQSIYYIKLVIFKRFPILLAILATILNCLKTLMRSAWCRSKFITATCYLEKLTTKSCSYIQGIYFINLDRFQNKPHYSGHLSGQFEFLKTCNDASTI